MHHTTAALLNQLQKDPRNAEKLAELLAREEDLTTLKAPAKILAQMNSAAANYFARGLAEHASELNMLSTEWAELAHAIFDRGRSMTAQNIEKMLKATKNGQAALMMGRTFTNVDNSGKHESTLRNELAHAQTTFIDAPGAEALPLNHMIKYGSNPESLDRASYLMRHPDHHNTPDYAEVHGRHHHHR